MKTANKPRGWAVFPKKLTAELAASAILASVIESYLLLAFGLLVADDLRVFLLVAVVLGIADIIAILGLEELILKTKFRMRSLRRGRR